MHTTLINLKPIIEYNAKNSNFEGENKNKKWQNSERETVANDLITVERRKGKTKPTTCLFWHPRPSTRLFVNIIWTTLFDFGCKLVLDTLWLIFELFCFTFPLLFCHFVFAKINTKKGTYNEWNENFNRLVNKNDKFKMCTCYNLFYSYILTWNWWKS